MTNDRLRQAMEAGKSLGWDWDVKTGRDRWFGDLQTIFGIQSDSYSGRVEDFHRLVHPEDRALVAKAVADARRSRKPYAAEFRVLRPDGNGALDARAGESSTMTPTVTPSACSEWRWTLPSASWRKRR